ncbi:hypothetical protein GA707_10010 [Nostocoides sp. F2B08]|uniref:LVIVD repeat-containing protein n=1 Tax=Nostocoides sp. F2B08 TaxID=2653936 RepID=UPI001262C72B|nr:hypothetical protein [Tetrasphaera sp. F2B08]KAB7743821.1 hypothetical protein GA707_10010 [Tetrasphaera sp. F2B08]
MPAPSRSRGALARRLRAPFALAAAAALGMTVLPAGATADPNLPSTDDPRYSLEGDDSASLGADLLANLPNTAPLDTDTYINSDMAFTGDHVIQGSYGGFNVIDVSDPANPFVRTSVLCPGSQGDVNVYGDLMFTSVQAATARVDCGTEGAGPSSVPNPERARGVRIWDISDLDNPVQLAVIQTCRGSHTNRLVEDPNDPDHVYIYNSGTSGQRAAGEAVHTPDGLQSGRCGQLDASGENPSQWMIEVIKVPLSDPASASVVKEARLFADPGTGAVNGLQNGPTRAGHPCTDFSNPFDPTRPNACSPAGSNYSPTPNTNTCHDITAYPEIGLAAGACQGNGILIDISDPADPVRIDAVADENFAYWHSANFNNDGTTVMFTDEWGGGGGARCMPQHRKEWGANAFFSIDRSGATPKLVFQGYYKLPAAQDADEICVAHQANILPVPGRDIAVQAWYSGGASLFDFTDPANVKEIGYFDRGPGETGDGYWSVYWYNGAVYGNEIVRGLDTMRLTPTADLTANEIAAATTVQLAEHNAMAMRTYEWELSHVLVRAQVDQLERAGGIPANKAANVNRALEKAETANNAKQATAQLRAASNQLDRNDPDQAAILASIQELLPS